MWTALEPAAQWKIAGESWERPMSTTGRFKKIALQLNNFKIDIIRKYKINIRLF